MFSTLYVDVRVYFFCFPRGDFQPNICNNLHLDTEFGPFVTQLSFLHILKDEKFIILLIPLNQNIIKPYCSGRKRRQDLLHFSRNSGF